ncbi:MAG: hypothetical protein B6242_07745 [Anaerolineaceae bacterium 4572_78]|nr:MAG: hypothetical protein B6242_07745 [Anaerolineaceae bacterium 4572_78]
MPSLAHSYIQAKLIGALLSYEQYNVHSELTLTIQDKDYVPDIALYSKKSIDFFNDVIKMTEMPLLAVEVISPTQSIKEITDKFNIYFEAGIQSCWLVQPFPGIITVCTSQTNKHTYANGEVVDEILNVRFPLKDIFS